MVSHYFQRELVGAFRPEGTAPAASMNMSASNVVQNTQAVTVPLMVPITVSEIKAQEAQLKLRVLHSKPVTPVRVDWLEFLLQGYDEGLS